MTGNSIVYEDKQVQVMDSLQASFEQMVDKKTGRFTLSWIVILEGTVYRQHGYCLIICIAPG